MNAETKKKIMEVHKKYQCAGDVIARTAMADIMQKGKEHYEDDEICKCYINEINARHDIAKAKGNFLFISRELEIAIVNCEHEFAQFTAYDLLSYAYEELYFSADVPDYHKMKKIVKNLLLEYTDFLREMPKMDDESDEEIMLRYMSGVLELSDSEIELFGYGYLFDCVYGTEDEDEMEEY